LIGDLILWVEISKWFLFSWSIRWT